ncbi:hypothetical protein ACFX14_012370 [Malus domestica]
MLIRKVLEHDALHGIKLSHNGTPLTHLSFVDDFVLFGSATVEKARGIARILTIYARGSGQEINLAKSSIFF